MKTLHTSLPFDYPGRPALSDQESKPSSLYLTSYDGTKIALDVFQPAEMPAGPVPAIVMVTRDNRRNLEDFEIRQCREFVRAGYAVVIVELRGCGVSYGVNNSFCDEQHCHDLIATINWAVMQPWCNGKIGLYGGSNRAFIQLCCGAFTSKNITAITPVVAIPDFYYQNYPNGVSACPDIHLMKPEKMPTKEEFLRTAVPVDEDTDGELAYEAFRHDHWNNNRNFFETLLLPNMNRDTPHPLYHNEKTNLTIPPYGKLTAFFETGVKQHQFVGQLESGTLGQLAHHVDFGGTLCLGPWTHSGAILGHSPFPNGEYSVLDANLKWYDYALKGKKNGWDQAPPVSYYVFGAEEGQEWRFSDTWPPENEARTTLYLCAEHSGTSGSCNDGVLARGREEQETVLLYRIRDDIAVFPREDGSAGYNRSELYWDGDMEPTVDCKGLTFTSAPLFSALPNEFAGCISVDLWISCNQKDVDLVIYAEEVYPDGRSHYIKDGVMRASHRTTGSNPAWEKLGAVWHTSMTADVERCLNEGLSEPTLLQFAIDPICYHFQPNSRLRITITCANRAAFQHTMDYETLPELRLYLGGTHTSCISVPFLEQTNQSTTGFCGAAPASLYRFSKNTYLFTKQRWYRFSSQNQQQIDGNELKLSTGLSFRQHGQPSPFPAANLPFFPEAPAHPIPRFPRQLVSVEEVNHRDYTLFVPSSKSLYIDIFKKDSGSKQPCIVFVHGFGVASCFLPEQMLRMYNRGFVIASVDLRHYPPNLYPDYIQDIKGQIRFLRAHADEYGIDPDRIGIYGFSLGGNSALMIALTGDDPSLEGSIGGNLEYSSRVQAAACGFAWSDLLHMGSDIAEEDASTDALTIRRVEMTEGEFSPSSEVIGFAGKGRGLKVLREYAERISETSDPYLEEKLHQAQQASPLNHVTPSAPPIALFGGYGEDGVNIAFRQCLRMFTALEQAGCLAFLFGNTHGRYGETEESLSGIQAFFERQLFGHPDRKKLVITAGQRHMTVNDVSRGLQSAAVQTDDGIWLELVLLQPHLPANCRWDAPRDGKINLLTLSSPGLRLKHYPDFHSVVLLW